MRSVIQNLVINQWASFSFVFSLSNADGTPKDLTGASIRSEIRKAYASATSIPFSADAIDAENGTIELTLTAEETGAIRDGRYVYDVVVDDGVEIVRVLEGIVTVNPGVTRLSTLTP